MVMLIIHPVSYRLTRSCWKEGEVASRIHPHFRRPAVNPCYRRANANTERRYCPLISDGVALEILASEMWKIVACAIRDEKDEVISFISFFLFLQRGDCSRLGGTRDCRRKPQENNGSVSALDSADFLSRRMRLVKKYINAISESRIGNRGKLLRIKPGPFCRTQAFCCQTLGK